MDPQTRLALNAINREFYAAEESAAGFSATRDHPWPGWERVWREVRRNAPTDRALSVLDAGCGNGRFAAFLAERSPETIHYVGIDASQPLLKIAAQRAQPLARAQFVCGDLTNDHLEAITAKASTEKASFDSVVLFGVLHHIPGFEARAALLAALAELVTAGGLLAFTLWRFGAPSLWPRFQSRVLPWRDYNRSAATPLDLAQLEAGDHLLRWGDNPGSNDAPLRYCHYVDDAERDALLATLPLENVEHYVQDGRSNDLNQYVVLRSSP